MRKKAILPLDVSLMCSQNMPYTIFHLPSGQIGLAAHTQNEFSPAEYRKKKTKKQKNSTTVFSLVQS